MKIDTFRGDRPKCRCCGKSLRPIYKTVREGINEPTGRRKVWDEEGRVDPPGDPSKRCVQHESSTHFEWFWSPAKQNWFRWEKSYRIRSRTFTGKFGVNGCGLFCSKECGFQWAVNRLS